MRVKGDWVTEIGAQTIFSMLHAAGYHAYFVGGCVRNALLNTPINDIDIATDATPDQVSKMAKSSGIRVIETGFDHGTVTLVTNGHPYEVTTFRRDIETDGRHAVVSFSKNIRDDALRRDFTMNALYADKNGLVVDPLEGWGDLEARLVRFIKNPDDRIKEDYLRILRFFRFYAWYGNPLEGIDAEGFAACSANLAGLETLAKERISAEMLKLLSANDPAPAVSSMAQSGVLGAILQGSDAEKLALLVHLEIENNAPVRAIRRLAVLGGQNTERSLRLSTRDFKTLGILREEMGSMRSASELGYRFGESIATDVLLLRGAIFETPISNGSISQAKHASTEVFPVKAADLMPALQGPALGAALRALEAEWVSSEFMLSKKALLERAIDL